MRHITLYIFVITILLSSCAEDKSTFIENGDLLFQDLDCGELCDAIESVTQGVDGAQLSHVGIAVKDSLGNVSVIEAYGTHVVKTSLNDFLNRSFDKEGNPKVIVGRVKKEYNELMQNATKEAEQLIGTRYDDAFLINNNSMYCSELVFYSYLMANSGAPVFKLQPMTFKPLNDSIFFPAWEEYYKNLKCEIPEGKPGLNPGSISRSDYIDIIYTFGYPTGYKPEKPTKGKQ